MSGGWRVDPAGNRWFCVLCEPESEVTDRVLAQRDQHVSFLRADAADNDWRVRVTCPNGHRMTITGQ